MDSYEREALDEAYAALTDVFGEGFPQAATLTQKGDGFVGQFIRFDENVDLKTGFAPVDMIVFRAIAGVWHTDAGIERARKGEVYSFALMHTTVRNRITEAMPIVSDEVFAIRRGRQFESTFNPGQVAVSYDVNFPNRPKDEPKKPKGKAARRNTRRQASEPTPPPTPDSAPPADNNGEPF